MPLEPRRRRKTGYAWARVFRVGARAAGANVRRRRLLGLGSRGDPSAGTGGISGQRVTPKQSGGSRNIHQGVFASPVWDMVPLWQRREGFVFSRSPQPEHGGGRCSMKPRCKSIITCSNKSGQFQLNIAQRCSFSLFAATPSYLWGTHLKKEVWRTGMHLSNYNLFSFLLAGLGVGKANLFGALESGFSLALARVVFWREGGESRGVLRR